MFITPEFLRLLVAGGTLGLAALLLAPSKFADNEISLKLQLRDHTSTHAAYNTTCFRTMLFLSMAEILLNGGSICHFIKSFK